MVCKGILGVRLKGADCLPFGLYDKLYNFGSVRHYYDNDFILEYDKDLGIIKIRYMSSILYLYFSSYRDYVNDSIYLVYKSVNSNKVDYSNNKIDIFSYNDSFSDYLDNLINLGFKIEKERDCGFYIVEKLI